MRQTWAKGLQSLEFGLLFGAFILGAIVLIQVLGPTLPDGLPWETIGPVQDVLQDLTHQWQTAQASWVPTGSEQYLPILLALLALALLRLWHQRPTPWMRAAVAMIAIGLGLRYLAWRLVCTLNFDNPINSVLGVSLFLAEGLTLFNGFCQLGLTIVGTDRLKEADRHSEAVLRGDYLPSVDVIIPTYNEPADILRRTVMGCQAMDYPNARIYLLDDLRRPEIRQLAEHLGCGYRDRPSNEHAKAGNINHALPSLGGELIAVFDADYIPSRNFLSRTIGFFQDAKTAMVQTPQNFFNEDPVTANLGLEGVVTNEQNLFFRHLQPSRDVFNAVICCGSCFVVRRSALDEIGGIPTESIAEDMFTSFRLQALGYAIKYLNEPLSAGMSAENITAYANQRLRWGRGTLQSMFCATNMLTMPGLNLWQRTYHFLSVLYWVQSVPRLMFLLMPITYFLFGWTPISATVSDIIYFYFPFYFINVLSFSWLAGGRRSGFWSDVYETLLCIPNSVMVFQTCWKPFGKGFKVTPKGVTSSQINVNWGLILPLATVALLTVGGALYFWLNRHWQTDGLDSFGFNCGWMVYNLILLSVTMLAAIDIPQRRHSRFLHELDGDLQLGDDRYWARLEDISESGAKLRLAPQSVQTQFLDEGWLTFNCGDRPQRLGVKLRWAKGNPQRIYDVGLEWRDLSDDQYRQLIEFLYCRPGQWDDPQIPEYRTAWALVSSAFRLYPLAKSR